MNNTTFASYIEDGCGRCHLYKSPECKVHQWTEVLKALRELVLGVELEEAMKWGSPVYMVGGAKQSKTRARRAEKCAEKIVGGKGWNER